jgi:hypothetical protein
MEEFIDGIRTLLGVLGHRVLEPLIARSAEPKIIESIAQPVASSDANAQPAPRSPTSSRSQVFELRVSNLNATAVRTDEGLVILADSEAVATVQSSLSVGYRALREHLLSSGVLVENGVNLKFARDQLFRSPSQAAAIVVGYSINGRHHWRTPDGITFSDFESRLARNTYGSGGIGA